MTEFMSVSEPVARKPHRCMACMTKIVPGDSYIREFFTDGGHGYEWILCTECDKLTSDVEHWSYTPDDGIYVDDYIDWAYENPEDDGAKRFIERWESYRDSLKRPAEQ